MIDSVIDFGKARIRMLRRLLATVLLVPVMTGGLLACPRGLVACPMERIQGAHDCCRERARRTADDCCNPATQAPPSTLTTARADGHSLLPAAALASLPCPPVLDFILALPGRMEPALHPGMPPPQTLLRKHTSLLL